MNTVQQPDIAAAAAGPEPALHGKLLIGGEAVAGSAAPFEALTAADSTALGPSYHAAGSAEIDHACRLAASAFDAFRATAPDLRAALLEAIGAGLLALGPALIERAMAECGLPRARLEGERARTIGQLGLFAQLLRDGAWHGVVIDPALPQRTPPRPELRLRNIPLGPVAVFGASNFPLAFSVAGGDRAAALAAGCPVLVKAHPAHPGTSELVGRVVQQAVRDAGLPAGVFALLAGDSHALGQQLVQHPAVQAVGFTGSRAGGLALCQLAAARPQPIPVFAEMSSINPVFLLPAALHERAESIAHGCVDSLVLGAGQFCTNPGLVLGIEGPDLDRFLAEAARALADKPAQTMLSSGIHAACRRGIERWAATPGVRCLAQGSAAAPGSHAARAALFVTDATNYRRHPALADEVFGPAGLVVGCRDAEELLTLAEALEGQLTATLQMHDADEADLALARRLLPVLERKAGRILANGFPTGVEVAHAMVHGGPFPATSDARSTSVGARAIERFLRPVCYQGLPEALLPPPLQSTNPLGLPRLVDARPEQR